MRVINIALRGIIVAALCVSLMGATGCPPKGSGTKVEQFVSLAQKAGSIAVKLKPVIQPLVDSGQLPHDLPARVDQFKSITSAIATAFQGGTGDPLALTSTAINLLEQFINDDAVKIQNPGTRVVVLAILSVADIALGELSDDLKKEGSTQPIVAKAAKTAQPNDVRTIEEFAAKPRLRCRNASTGRFEKMSFCEAHPEASVVERVK